MPFLRYTRDKRGYENTFVMHTPRRRGRSRQQILYWFRTPPNVKVGRAALDEDAIRSIEQNNPDLSFDWPKILEVQSPPAQPVADAGRMRRGRRVKGARRDAPGSPAPESKSRTPLSETEDESSDLSSDAAVTPDRDETPIGESDSDDVQESVLARPSHSGDQLGGQSAVETVIGQESLTRLRARFAELQARITERGGDPERIKALRLQVESLNPDTWVTIEEARKGLEECEVRFEEVRRVLGLRRRRRSRRGGRRRHRGRTTGPSASAQEGQPAPAQEESRAVEAPDEASDGDDFE